MLTLKPSRLNLQSEDTCYYPISANEIKSLPRIIRSVHQTSFRYHLVVAIRQLETWSLFDITETSSWEISGLLWHRTFPVCWWMRKDTSKHTYLTCKTLPPSLRSGGLVPVLLFISTSLTGEWTSFEWGTISTWKHLVTRPFIWIDPGELERVFCL